MARGGSIGEDRSTKGTGSTGLSHPFRRKNERMIRRQEAKAEQRRQVTLEELVYTFGVPVGDLLDPSETLAEIDRFEDEHRLEHRGVDVVLARFAEARYDHEEYEGENE